jgi:hypothetical protein
MASVCFASGRQAAGRPGQGLVITIQPVGGEDGEHLAWFRSQPMQATYSVFFRDSLMGVIALHEFCEMIRHKYKVDGIRLEVCDQQVAFRSPAVLDVLSSGQHRSSPHGL